MDRRGRSVKVWPLSTEPGDDDPLEDVEFGAFGLDEASENGLFQADLPLEDVRTWEVNDDVFSAVDFETENLLRRTRQRKKPAFTRSVRDRKPPGRNELSRSTQRGHDSKRAHDSPVRSGGRTSPPHSGDSNSSDVSVHDGEKDAYDDEEEVAFGQDDQALVREREAKEREKLQLAKVSTQVKMLLERVNGFREQALKAKQEATSCAEENRELKVKIEQMKEDTNDIMMAQARSGLAAGMNRAAGKDGKNARDLDAEMRRRRLAKNALLAGVQTEEEEDLVITLEGITTGMLAQLTGRFYRWLGKKLPLGADVRAIQARYGSAVASYFHFYRWLVGSYILIASPSLVWMVFHILSLDRQAVFGATLVGIIPSFLAYSSFDSSSQNSYAIMIVLTIAMQVISATIKWVREDKIRKELFIVDEEQKHVQFAKTFLVGWDNTLSNEQEVEDLRLSNGLAAANMLAEISQADTYASRSIDDRIRLYFQRSFGFALYIGLQMAAWVAILYLTAQSDNLAEGLAEQLQAVGWLTQAAATISTSIVPATVTIINAIMPIIIKAITKLEKWDGERTVTSMLTTRMFLAKILNACIQALSYLLLSNPYLFAADQYSEVRRRVEQNFDPTGFSCRIDQAGAGLFQLVVTEFIFSKIINYATLRAAQAKAKWAKRAFVKPEFEVAKRMVGLLYFQALILAAFPFFPLGTVFIAPFLILSFKFEMTLLTTFQSKPKGRLKAHDGYSFFIKFYLATLVLLGMMVTLFLVGNKTFVKNCDIQDDGIYLCGSSPVDSDTSVCTPLDGENKYYEWFSDVCGDDQYPACLCEDELACGPFVEVPSAFSSLDTELRSLSVFGSLYGYLMDYSIIVWCLAMTLWLVILFQRNSTQTQADAAADREREWLNEAQATQARVRKQAKLIEKMQLQAGALLFEESGGG